MGIFRRRPGYDRLRLLNEAGDARAKKQRRRAIALYRQVLAVEPGNPEIHRKLAPLLAETGQAFEAWVSFRTTAGGDLRQGQLEKALAVYQEASRYLTREIDVWQAMAKLHRKKGRDSEALQVLLEGRQQFRGRRLRGQAVYLLRRALEIEPWDCETVLDLARLLSKTRQAYEAERLLSSLASRVPDHQLRRVRGAQFRLNPTLGNAWRWLRALHSRPARAALTAIEGAKSRRSGLQLQRGVRPS